MKHIGIDEIRMSVWRNLLLVIALSICTSLTAYSDNEGVSESEINKVLNEKINEHPYVTRLTTWGSRPDWSADGKHLLFVSKEYGDVYELEVASGDIEPLTYHFPHKGFFRAYYLKNGDILLTGARDFDVEKPLYGRFYGSELWVLKRDLSGPPQPLNQENAEGVAVSRNSMRIAWNLHSGPKPSMEEFAGISTDSEDKMEMWTGEIAFSNGRAEIVNKQKLLDCSSEALEKFGLAGKECTYLETQNFILPEEKRLVFTAVKKGVSLRIEALTLDLDTGKARLQSKKPWYNEAEGIFPSGKYTLVEHFGKGNNPDRILTEATERLDLWRLTLDGSGEMRRVTSYNELHPLLKSNQGVISLDGRWMAFTVANALIERRTPGQGMGLFLMDLEKAGLK